MESDASVTGPGDGGEDGDLLDCRTQLGESLGNGSGWAIAAYPEVGEATVYWQSEGSAGGDEESRWSKLEEEERAALNQARKLQRARTRMRRYFVRNKLTRFDTWTYRCVACQGDPCDCGRKAQPASRAEVKRHVNAAIRELRDLVGEAFAYLYVIERGSKGTRRLHVHVALPPWVAESAVGAAWRHGNVVAGEGGSGDSLRDRARAASSYMAKYLGKALEDDDEAWAHSYERAQGFNVRVVSRSALPSLATALDLVVQLLGVSRDGLRLSWSDEWADWFGPPTAAVRLA